MTAGPAQVIQTQHPVTTAHVLTGPGPGGTMGQPQTLIVNNVVGARNGISLTPASGHRPQQVRRHTVLFEIPCLWEYTF